MEHELAFGPLALELNPSALAGAGNPTATYPEPGRVAVLFQSKGLSPAARELLMRLPGTRFEAGPCAGRELLRAEVAALADAACHCPEAAVLLEARKGLEPPADPPEIMGVINVTPDSFSDGGVFLDPGRAVEHGLELEALGASILDVGGESTRPGAEPVPAEEELRRVLPVVRELARRGRCRISIDTTKASVARAALEAGASMVNDVRAGEADGAMLPLIAESGCEYVLMHARGRPKDMQVDPRYADAPSEVLDYLRRRVAECLRTGIAAARIVVDPGIGFGKRLEHNTSLLRRLSELRSLGRPLLVGVSRKSFIGHITGEQGPGPSSRLGGTAAAVTVCVLGGAEILRVHDVGVLAETIQVAAALRPEPASNLAKTAPDAKGH